LLSSTKRGTVAQAGRGVPAGSRSCDRARWCEHKQVAQDAAMPVAVAKPLPTHSSEAVQAKCVRRRSLKTDNGASPKEESSRVKGKPRGSAGGEESTRSGYRRGQRRASLAGRRRSDLKLQESITSTSSQAAKQFASLGTSESRFFHVVRASIIGQHHINLAQVCAAHV
jgi:hypothetical protein